MDIEQYLTENFAETSIVELTAPEVNLYLEYGDPIDTVDSALDKALKAVDSKCAFTYVLLKIKAE